MTSVALAQSVDGLREFAPPDLWQAGERPTRRYYRRYSEVDGRVRGRTYSRRRARYAMWVLDNGVVVRMQERQRGRVVLERRFDPVGQPLTTERRPRNGWPSITVHQVPDRQIGMSGWDAREVPGGTVSSPVDFVPRGAGGVSTWVLGGELAVWHDERPVDPTADPYWEGLLAGCGCDLIDRVTAWVDNRPAVRFRLARGGDVQELWAVPLDPERDGVGGAWYASYWAPDTAPSDTSLRLAPGRALVALLRLDRLDGLAPSEGDP